MFVPADDCLGGLVCNSLNVCAEGQAVGAHCNATGMRLASALAHAMMQLTEFRLAALHPLPAANCTTGPQGPYSSLCYFTPSCASQQQLDCVAAVDCVQQSKCSANTCSAVVDAATCASSGDLQH